MSDLKKAAVYYASLGWHVFPIVPGTKAIGLLNKAQRGSSLWGASNEPVRVAKWWDRWPDANIGCACGPSGMFVLDVDQHSPDKNGAASLSDLELAPGNDVLRPTLQQVTPSGGMHYIFADPGHRGRNTESDIAPGLDTRGGGGMIVLPPSRLDPIAATANKPARAGGVYSWVKPKLKMADAPGWLLDLLPTKGGPAGASEDQEPVAELDTEGNVAWAIDYLKGTSKNAPSQPWANQIR